MNEKKQLRRLMKQKIEMMTEPEKQGQSHLICQRIMQSKAWRHAKTVMIYDALADEVSLKELEANAEGRTMVCPKQTADAAMIDSLTIQTIDLAIIPGRAFTSDGKRLGRGGGYYDRLLAQMSCQTIGVCFSCQLVDDLPTEPWDLPLMEVYTVL